MNIEYATKNCIRQSKSSDNHKDSVVKDAYALNKTFVKFKRLCCYTGIFTRHELTKLIY